MNIAVLTNALGFGEFHFTVVLTVLMLLACLFLLCWDYPRWKGLLFASDSGDVAAAQSTRGGAPAKWAWWCAALGGIGLECIGRGILRPGLAGVLFLTLLGAAALLALCAGIRTWMAHAQPPAA